MGLVCRVAEAAGITTVCISTGRDLTKQVKPPRSLFVNFPMGNAFGKPFDRDMQTAILRAALDLAEHASEPGVLVDLPYVWPEPFEFNPGGANMQPRDA
ncbi:MAG: hypothetical protein R3E86_05125 [Pseudomonadales bacterium]